MDPTHPLFLGGALSPMGPLGTQFFKCVCYLLFSLLHSSIVPLFTGHDHHLGDSCWVGWLKPATCTKSSELEGLSLSVRQSSAHRILSAAMWRNSSPRSSRRHRSNLSGRRSARCCCIEQPRDQRASSVLADCNLRQGARHLRGTYKGEFFSYSF